MDADARDQLAHLSPYRLGVHARAVDRRATVADARPLPDRRRPGRPARPAAPADRRSAPRRRSGARPPALAHARVVQVWHVIALSLFLGAMNAIEPPTRQAFLLEMVETKADLPNAIALQSMLFNGARFVGPTIAGVLLALSGEALCFLLNGISYLGVVIAYLAIRVPARAP